MPLLNSLSLHVCHVLGLWVQSSVRQGPGVQEAHEIQGDGGGKMPRAMWHLCASSASKVHGLASGGRTALCTPLSGLHQNDWTGTAWQEKFRYNRDPFGVDPSSEKFSERLHRRACLNAGIWTGFAKREKGVMRANWGEAAQTGSPGFRWEHRRCTGGLGRVLAQPQFKVLHSLDTGETSVLIRGGGGRVVQERKCCCFGN